jgi:hypothetical protein
MKSKCPACRALAGRLNAKTIYFHPLCFELDLTFELCHLSLVNEFFFNFLRQSRSYAFCLAELLQRSLLDSFN